MNVKQVYGPHVQEFIAQSLRTACRKAQHRSNKLWFKLADCEHVLNQILTGQVMSAIVDDSYLVVYDIGTPWWSPDKVIIEEKLVLDLGGPSDLSCVEKYLSHLGVVNGADAVAVGTALAHSDRALSRKYQSLGFEPQDIQLMKEL